MTDRAHDIVVWGATGFTGKLVAEYIAKNAPAGSDVAIAAVKSAIAAANTAYDNMTKAAKQVGEMAETNLAAATNATLKATKAG